MCGSKLSLMYLLSILFNKSNASVDKVDLTKLTLIGDNEWVKN